MNFHQSRAPLTADELKRRAEALSANAQGSDRAQSHAGDEAADTAPSDERQYGPTAAKILREVKRSVALASQDAKLAVFTEAAATLADAVVSQWVPKSVMVDRLLEIAMAHGCFGRDQSEIENMIGQTAEGASTPTQQADQASSSSKPSKRRLIAHRASELEPEKLVWVWPGRIPEGKLVLLGGPPGLGKSQLTAFMSATVSNGGHWPCGEGSTLPGDVIFMSAEDGVQDTIIPRLMAAGADRERVHIVSAATKPDGTGRKTFSLKTDVDLLEEMARTIGTVRLIIVDPISAYMGGSDGNGNVETREVLEPLADMANRLRIAVVAVTHLNKGGGGGNQSALNRFAGSIAFVAAARAAFAVIEDPEDDERRFLLQAKNNLGKKCKGLAFRLEQRLVGDDVMSSNVMFEGDHVSESIDEALSASENRGTKKGQSSGGKEDVMQLLRDIFSAGPVDVLEVERQARAAALLEDDKRLSKSKVFRDARDALGVLTTREGFGPGSKFILSLPDAPLAPIGAIGAPSQTRAPMEEKGAYGESGGAS
ncbi:AAA family ATPase [Bradyrhizobium sp. 2]|uniref:AAA family ATPase n=1 Tax=unclassified Bradyrhizobium TaxID=2631580 RepID=UPI001FFAB905|nr:MULTISPECIES: AAA family ATPase [unclassified Bradyrhizobium]MCK1447238.1 AAA family ATPase [Bradyrhizobium sp. 48]MCK1464401.1 AAA family ATPase [Bradyrhizobium sp. 2]